MALPIAVRSAAFSDVVGGANFGTIFGLLAVASTERASLNAGILGTRPVDEVAAAMDRLPSPTPRG